MNKYLKHSRLEDVLCAIQFLSSSNGTSLTAEKWAENIKSKPSSANNSWGELFDEHPEFFMCTPGSDSDDDDSELKKYYALVWRRAMPRNFHKSSASVHTAEQISDAKKQRIFQLKDYGWSYLTHDQTTQLMEIAIKLHKNAVDEQSNRRWKLQFYVPILVAIVGALATVVIQYYPKSFEKDITEIKSILTAMTANSTKLHKTK